MTKRTPTVRLIADAVENFGDSRVYSVGLTETPVATDDMFALIFSVTEPDDDGSGYSVVLEPGQRTVYGGIETCRLVGKVLHLRFTEPASRELGLPRELAVRLAVADDQIGTLERGLERVGIRFANRFAKPC